MSSAWASPWRVPAFAMAWRQLLLKTSLFESFAGPLGHGNIRGLAVRPKACGLTATAAQHCEQNRASSVYLQTSLHRLLGGPIKGRGVSGASGSSRMAQGSVDICS